MIIRASAVRIVVAALAAVAFFVGAIIGVLMPHLAHAQAGDVQTTSASNDALRAAIMSAVASDPRASSLEPSQLGNLVDSLAQSAQSAGIQAAGISVGNTIPESSAQGSGSAMCGNAPAWLCRISESLGFIGTDITEPLLLGTLALVLLLIGVLIKIHHRRTGVHPLL